MSGQQFNGLYLKQVFKLLQQFEMEDLRFCMTDETPIYIQQQYIEANATFCISKFNILLVNVELVY